MTLNSTLIDNYCENFYEFIRDKVLQDLFGPRYVPTWYRYTFGVIYSLILISGVMGNFCICIVIGTNKHMHRSTNLYLFSLSISDLMILLFGLPVELIQSQSQLYPWRYGVFFCHLRNLMLELTPIASVLTITAFSVERYVAICYPMKAHVISSRKRTCVVIGLAWMIALIFSLPISAMSKSIHMASFPNDTAQYVKNITNNFSSCISKEMKNRPQWYKPGQHIPQSLLCSPDLSIRGFSELLKLIAFVFFVLPIIIIIILYTLIAKKLFLTSTITNNMKNSKSFKSRKSVTKMLAAVVVSFFSCWAPFHLQRMITINGTTSIYSQTFLLALFYISGSLLYVSPTINPVIYNMMSARFRQAFCFTFRKFIYCFMDASNWPSTFEVTIKTHPERSFASYNSASKLNVYPLKSMLNSDKSILHKSPSTFLTVNMHTSFHRYSSVESLEMLPDNMKFSDKIRTSISEPKSPYEKGSHSTMSTNEYSKVLQICHKKDKIYNQKKNYKFKDVEVLNNLEIVPMIKTTFIDEKI